jgi:hypothetical protein
MGLDMYVESLDASFVTDEDQVDINPRRKIAEAVGINCDEEFYLSMSDEGRDCWDKQSQLAIKNAEADGKYNHEFYYWRKFHHLHGWMSDLYYAKGGEQECFNCCTVRLTENDLDKLLSDATRSLPKCTGFFYGERDWDESCLEEVQEFVKAAKDELAQGKALFYDSWW